MLEVGDQIRVYVKLLGCTDSRAFKAFGIILQKDKFDEHYIKVILNKKGDTSIPKGCFTNDEEQIIRGNNDLGEISYHYKAGLRHIKMKDGNRLGRICDLISEVPSEVVQLVECRVKDDQVHNCSLDKVKNIKNTVVLESPGEGEWLRIFIIICPSRTDFSARNDDKGMQRDHTSDSFDLPSDRQLIIHSFYQKGVTHQDNTWCYILKPDVIKANKVNQSVILRGNVVGKEYLNAKMVMNLN